jgi:hypothetical protein
LNFTTQQNPLPNQAPVINLSKPDNDTQINNTSNVTLNFTVTDDLSTILSCGLYINSILNQTNSSTINNTLTNFRLYVLPGQYNWSVNCSDGSLSNVSETRAFTINDTTSPSITLLGCTPSPAYTSDSVLCRASINDYGALGVVLANVTHVNGSVYNQSVSCSGTINSKTCSFTFSATTLVGRYNFTWFANDTNGYSNTSSSYFAVQKKPSPPSEGGGGGGHPVDVPPFISRAGNITEAIVPNVTVPVQPPKEAVVEQPVEKTPIKIPELKFKFPYWILIIIVIIFLLLLFMPSRKKEKKKPGSELAVHAHLADYIRETRAKGFGDKEITEKLKSTGWEKENIDEAFRKL